MIPSYVGSLLHGVRKLVEVGQVGRLISTPFPWQGTQAWVPEGEASSMRGGSMLPAL